MAIIEGGRNRSTSLHWLFAALPALILPDKPQIPNLDSQVSLPFRRTGQQVQAAAANIDGAWERIAHAAWIKNVESEKRRRPERTVEPEPSFLPEVSDEVFLRRATLDATGVIPTEAETRAFLNDPLPDKRYRLVERVLLGPGWGRQQFNRYADPFRLKDVVGGVPQAGYIALIRTAAEANVPFDRMIAGLLTASGNVADNPATGYLLRDQGNCHAFVMHDRVRGVNLSGGCRPKPLI